MVIIGALDFVVMLMPMSFQEQDKHGKLLVCSHNVGLNMAVTIITSVFTQSWACCVLLLPNIQPNNSVDHSSHSSGNFRF